MVKRPPGFTSGLAIPLLLVGCSPGPLSIAPPNVPEGGRIIALARAQTDQNRMVAASESGGLFRSFDGGSSWQHLDAFPNYMPVDVAIASMDPNTVIATAVAQFRVVNDGGIWRSTDGGASWTQPAGWAPMPGPNCPTRPSAYAISHQPLTRTFYVGTDCGISISSDNGATWRTITLETGSTSDSLKNRVRSILVLGRAWGVAAGETALWHLDNGGQWIRAVNNPNPSGQLTVTHAFAAPWWYSANPVLFYATQDHRLWRSTDGGARWVNIPAPREPIREAFVQIARARNQSQDSFDLYFGDGVRVQRHRFKSSDGTAAGPWEALASDHADPSQIAFDLDHRVPILLATDGGVHRTTNEGKSWKLTGAGTGGLSALQIHEITGQEVSGSSPHLDLYYGTQDNYFRASKDGGATWPQVMDGEGAFIRVMPTSVNHQDTRVSLRKCGECSLRLTRQHLEQDREWPSAPDGAANPAALPPFLIFGDSYIQGVMNTAASFDYFLSLSAGASWSPAFNITVFPVGPMKPAGSPANPTVFQGFSVSGLGGTTHGLIKASNLAGTATVARADGNGSIGLGYVHMGQARHVIFGVDPRDPNHLLAPDVVQNAMTYSPDGGDNWYPHTALTQAVTDNGKFLLHRANASLVTAIEWDPYQPCHILVGTKENGIIRSTDGGSSWSRVDGSQRLTWISSFYFPPTGSIWVSSYGRGLWRLQVDRGGNPTGGQCRFPVAP